MKKFLALLCTVFLFSCSTEYGNYHQNAQTVQTQTQSAKKVAAGFGLNTVADGTPNETMLPDKKQIGNMVAQLNGAKKRIWVEVYILTEKNVIAALVSAKARGVDVRAVLEP